MIITISGAAGSGKSTLGELLQKELKIPRIYVGQIRRDLAKRKKMTLSEFNKYSETHPQGDVDVDNKVKAEVKKLKDVILEGRVMYHFFPESIKIYLEVDPNIAAQRIFNDLKNRNEGKELNSIEKVKESIKKRKDSDNFRYNKYYNINIDDKNNFDLIINTTNINKKALLKVVLDYINSKKPA